MEKLDSVLNIKPPSNAKKLLAILGLVTYLNLYSIKLAEMTTPMRELTKKNTRFMWEPHHQRALNKIKEELCTCNFISYYDPDPTTTLTTILQCDASQSGVGAWLRQVDSEGNENIVAMASRTLINAKSRYSNIERKCLGIMYSLEKFEYYLLGRQVIVGTEHAPLEQIFKKNITEAPARLQRLLLRCLRFDVQVQYKQEKSIPVADVFSRLCFKEGVHSIENSEYGISLLEGRIHFIKRLIDLARVKSSTEQDPTVNLLKEVVYNGWPPYRKQFPQELWEFWNFRCDLVIEDGIVLKSNRIVLPKDMPNEVLQTIHSGHEGEPKCILLAR